MQELTIIPKDEHDKMVKDFKSIKRLHDVTVDELDEIKRAVRDVQWSMEEISVLLRKALGEE